MSDSSPSHKTKGILSCFAFSIERLPLLIISFKWIKLTITAFFFVVIVFWRKRFFLANSDKDKSWVFASYRDIILKSTTFLGFEYHILKCCFIDFLDGLSYLTFKAGTWYSEKHNAVITIVNSSKEGKITLKCKHGGLYRASKVHFLTYFFYIKLRLYNYSSGMFIIQ